MRTTPRALLTALALLAAGCLAADSFEHTPATTGNDGNDGNEGTDSALSCGDGTCGAGELGSTCPGDCNNFDLAGCATQLNACDQDEGCKVVKDCELTQCDITPLIACEPQIDPFQACGGVGSCVDQLNITSTTRSLLCDAYLCVARTLF